MESSEICIALFAIIALMLLMSQNQSRISTFFAQTPFCNGLQGQFASARKSVVSSRTSEPMASASAPAPSDATDEDVTPHFRPSQSKKPRMKGTVEPIHEYNVSPKTRGTKLLMPGRDSNTKKTSHGAAASMMFNAPEISDDDD